MAILEGCRKRDLHAYELALFGAFQAERFARTKKLKPLGKYLAELRPKRPQTPEEMLAVMRDLHARGAPMTFRKVH